jgi:hypothetical protein
MKPACGVALAVILPLRMFGVESRPKEAALVDVKRIYVDQLGGGKTSDQMRDMIITALQNSGLFVLTENPERADATLKGSGDDEVFNELHDSNDSIGVHASAGNSGASHSLYSGVSSNVSASAGVTDSESSRSQERHHEASASVRLVDNDGDIIWSTTQESSGGKFKGAMADVADKIMKQLADQTRRMRSLYSKTEPASVSATPAAANAKPDAAPNAKSDDEHRPLVTRNSQVEQ